MYFTHCKLGTAVNRLIKLSIMNIITFVQVQIIYNIRSTAINLSMQMTNILFLVHRSRSKVRVERNWLSFICYVRKDLQTIQIIVHLNLGDGVKMIKMPSLG